MSTKGDNRAPKNSYHKLESWTTNVYMAYFVQNIFGNKLLYFGTHRGGYVGGARGVKTFALSTFLHSAPRLLRLDQLIVYSGQLFRTRSRRQRAALTYAYFRVH
ncbi:hypothetical protein ANN_27036 [Periplaneta americana]|uniref:Per a allergen n=1 Tax=Periplaneta americana TaxID=6978 RepID=A0ABQ8RXG0_PERAM|nr:hypothetical protein ANN_27036 [Periplaneta americana]